jgi:competence protein ComEC
MKVKNVIISNQYEENNNLKEFLKIIEEKNIKLYEVSQGDKIQLEKNLFFEILWPDDNNIISENSINNNALVCKLNYNNFSMIFTGDIEEEAENLLITKFVKEDILSSTVLKVAHHGSKTSTTEEILKLINPKIAVIGVGKNNNFGHPNEEILERLKRINCLIYRTDENGEIKIKINKSGKIKIKTLY